MDVDDLVALGESKVMPTHVSSREDILYSDVTTVLFPPTYDFCGVIPLGFTLLLSEYDGLQKPKWMFNINSTLFLNRCDQSVYSDTSFFAGRNVCFPCLNLRSHPPHLLQVLAQSATLGYHDRLQDALSRAILLHNQKEKAILSLGLLRLKSFS